MFVRVFGWDGESKIADFINPVFVEDVGGFDVAVQVAAFVHIVVASDDLLDDLAGLIVGKLFFEF